MLGQPLAGMQPRIADRSLVPSSSYNHMVKSRHPLYSNKAKQEE